MRFARLEKEQLWREHDELADLVAARQAREEARERERERERERAQAAE